MTGPMDPERLELIREMVSEGVLDDHVESLAQVLADRDHHAREAERQQETAFRLELMTADRDRAKAEAERLRGELDARLRDLAIVYGRNECGQRFPGQDQLTKSARAVAARNGWPDPYPEADAPEASMDALIGALPSEETDAEFLDMLEGEQP